MSPTAEDIEMQSTAPPSDTGNDSASASDSWKDAQCWKDVKAETGFSSYVEYLESLQEGGPQFKDLLDFLKSRPEYDVFQGFGGQDFFVLDVLKDGSTSISLEMAAGFTEQPQADGYRQSTQLLQHLQSPSESVLARIVFWSSHLWYSPCNSIIDALGLGLKIQPAFFEEVSAFSPRRLGKLHALRPALLEIMSFGNNIATISQSYLEGGSPPVLLIAQRYDHIIHSTNRWERMYEDMLEELLGAEIGGSKSLWLTRRSPNSLAPISSNHYVSLIDKNIHQGLGIDEEAQAPLLIALLTLLHIEKMGVGVRCQIVRSSLLEVEFTANHPYTSSDEEKAELYDLLDQQRFLLRRKREDIEESRNRFVKYAQSQNATTLLQSRVWLSQVEDLGEVVIEARVREAEALDFMQLQMGSLSILESKKSIELSNKQIDEAKRGKRCGPSSYREIC